MEWGCMQALIDFDGWRKWKDFSQNNTENDSSKKTAVSAKLKSKKNRMSLGSIPSGTALNNSIKEEAEEVKQ
jgi:osomolarity two-component system, response regulator SSK1